MNKLQLAIKNALAKDPRYAQDEQKRLIKLATFDKPDKYHTAKWEDRTADNIVFDSKKEMERYLELKMLAKTHKITHFELQVPYLLLEGGIHKLTGISYSAIYYFPDFQYYDIKDPKQLIVEDSKGMRTDEYILKKKLFLAQYPDIRFIES